jgi:hypothetical protein
MSKMPTYALVLALSFAAAPFSAAIAADLPAGTVVLAKSSPDALLLWDSSPVLAKLVGDKVGEAKALSALESDAVTIASQRAAKLTTAKTVTVQVIYSMTGAVSPVYNTATFAGVEKVLTVSGAPADLVKNGTAYAASLAQGTVPAAVKVSVTGKLPPM